jgi:hypothetical protein
MSQRIWKRFPLLIVLCSIYCHAWRNTRGGAAVTVENEAIEQEEVMSASVELTSASKNRRHTSDLIQNLLEGAQDQPESHALRQMIMERTQQYLTDFFDEENETPHPRNLLQILAPKIPAIKHSPDVALRIQSVRSDMDSGVAASLVGVIAHVAEFYDKREVLVQNLKRKGDSVESSSLSIVKERRFEQLIECILCGVDVKKRMSEYRRQHLDHEAENIEEILDEEDAKIDEGLCVRDACRAAWGMAILGVHQLDTLGDEKVSNLLVALSLRIRELLLAQLQLLRQADLVIDGVNSIDDRLDDLSGAIAEDAASAMWAFGCVSACTGMRFAPLFEVCCSILCQNPVEMRRRAQEADETARVGSSDIVDRLARSEDSVGTNTTVRQETVAVAGQRTTPYTGKDALIDWLSPNEVTDVLWALALHGGGTQDSSRSESALSETVSGFREVACDRLVDWLRKELGMIIRNQGESRAELVKVESIEVLEGSGEASEDTVITTLEVVDAAAILEAERGAAGENSARDETKNLAIEDAQSGSGSHKVENVDVASIIDVGGDAGLGEHGSTFDRHDESEWMVELSKESAGSLDYAKAELQVFFPHDLCCIVWAVSELSDPLQKVVTELVTEIFAKLGPRRLDGLAGSDLSNLAWAIAKTESAATNSSLLLTKWIADYSIQSDLDGSDPESLVPVLLSRFHPPELSRLVWAVASTFSLSAYSKSSDSAAKLAAAALLTAAQNLSIFGAEDLVSSTLSRLEFSTLVSQLILRVEFRHVLHGLSCCCATRTSFFPSRPSPKHLVAP